MYSPPCVAFQHSMLSCLAVVQVADQASFDEVGKCETMRGTQSLTFKKPDIFPVVVTC